jgi:flagellar assembly protein FliH
MATIIKAAATSQPGIVPPLKAFQFDDVGSSYVSRVRAEAAHLINEAKNQAAQIRAQARQEGRQAAVQEVQAAFRSRLDEQLANVLAALGDASRQIADSRQAWQQHWERHAVELAAAMATRVCRRELSRQPEISAEWIREALALAAGSGAIVLRLHPDDCAALGPTVDAVGSRLAGIGTVQIVADPAISPGGCRVDTEFGSLDQQLESQLARLTEELLD